MQLYPYVSTSILTLALTTQIAAQTATNLWDNFTEIDPNDIKKTMLAYEKSHTAKTDTKDTSLLHWENILRNSSGQILKKWEFKNGIFFDWVIFKYDINGEIIEKHIYRNGKFLTKLTK